MRILGITLLFIGFFWIVWDTTVGVSVAQYSTWMFYSKHLPTGDVVTHQEASKAMAQLALALRDRQRIILVPACLMLAGGIVLTIRRRGNPPGV